MAEIGIFVGTMYGNSLLVAEEAEAILTAQGHKATVFEDPELSDWLPYQDKYVLVVTSTTGQGDLIALCHSFRESKIVWASSRICVMA
jgi:flavodoxin